MLIVRGEVQTLPSELNTAATGEVWIDPIFHKLDGVAVGTVLLATNGRTFGPARYKNDGTHV
jgi:hypothetical protein